MEDTFFWFAYNFGDINKVYQFHFASIDVPLIDAVVAFTVQMVYCWRIWVLSRWRVVPTLITLVHPASSSFLFFGHLTKMALDCPPGRSIRSSCWSSNSEYRDLYECGGLSSSKRLAQKGSQGLRTTFSLDYGTYRIPIEVFTEAAVIVFVLDYYYQHYCRHGSLQAP